MNTAPAAVTAPAKTTQRAVLMDALLTSGVPEALAARCVAFLKEEDKRAARVKESKSRGMNTMTVTREVEIEVYFEAEYEKAERATLEYPGSPGGWSIGSATRIDNGEDVELTDEEKAAFEESHND